MECLLMFALYETYTYIHVKCYIYGRYVHVWTFSVHCLWIKLRITIHSTGKLLYTCISLSNLLTLIPYLIFCPTWYLVANFCCLHCVIANLKHLAEQEFQTTDTNRKWGRAGIAHLWKVMSVTSSQVVQLYSSHFHEKWHLKSEKISKVTITTFLVIIANGTVVMSVRPVTERLLVQTRLWSPDVMCCAFRQGTLSALSQSTKVILGTALHWGVTCDELVS